MDYLQDERKVVYYPTIKLYSAKTVRISKIVLYDEHLRIDFTQYASRDYSDSGYTRVSRNIFVRPQGTTLRLPLVKAISIPLAPEKYYFKSHDEKIHFTLLFPAISKKVEYIDIIEKENGDNTNFNFHGVSLEDFSHSVVSNVHYYLSHN